MAVPAPQRHDEAVALLPFEFFTVDDRRAVSSKGVIDSAAIVPVRFGDFPGTEHLNTAG